MNNQLIKQALNELKNKNATAVLGIDGMVDEVWQLVDKRNSANEYDKIDNLISFGNEITQRGTGGMAKERILKRRTNGGFVCNTGRAVIALGVQSSFLGTFGKEPYDEIFNEFKDKAKFYSVGNSANIQILEFIDGKIMMPNLEAIINLTWKEITEIFDKNTIADIFNKDIVGIGYWSNMYDFENIMRNIVEICSKNKKTKRIFHDFANLNKRTKPALLQALDVLKQLNESIPQTLSLNEHEGAILCEALGISYPNDINNKNAMQPALLSVKAARDKIGIDEVVIHTLHFAVSSSSHNGDACSLQNYCEKPVRTAGAGDTFNGGYMVASLTDMPQEEKLVFSNACTYHFVSKGIAPTVEDILQYIK